MNTTIKKQSEKISKQYVVVFLKEHLGKVDFCQECGHIELGRF